MRGKKGPSDNHTTWCSSLNGSIKISMLTHMFILTNSSSGFSLRSFLFLFFPPSPRLFVVLHLPRFFECINQSSHSITAITHLVRIREGERGGERVHNRKRNNDRARQRPREKRARAGGKKENGEVQRVSCSAFIHLLKSLLTSRLFISPPIHPFIHPSTHSASNEPGIHSFTYL